MLVFVFLGGSKLLRFGNVCGEVVVSFFCDFDVVWKLVNFFLIDYLYINEFLLVLILD